MAHNFLEFVIAYGLRDVIVIEIGYQQHAPGAQEMGQKKYVEIWLRQQEVLYLDNAYSRLQEWQMNCVVRRYDRATGKRCVAHDTFLEHDKVFFQTFH